MSIQKLLIVLGLCLVVAGILWPYIAKSGLGRLPGDITIEGENYSFYFPLTTCLLISAVLSLFFWLFNK